MLKIMNTTYTHVKKVTYPYNPTEQVGTTEPTVDQRMISLCLMHVPHAIDRGSENIMAMGQCQA